MALLLMPGPIASKIRGAHGRANVGAIVMPPSTAIVRSKKQETGVQEIGVQEIGVPLNTQIADIVPCGASSPAAWYRSDE